MNSKLVIYYFMVLLKQFQLSINTLFCWLISGKGGETIRNLQVNLADACIIIIIAVYSTFVLIS